MAGKIKPADPLDERRVSYAAACLRIARDELVEAGALRAADKVRKALKSTEGALRHVQHRQTRTLR